MIAAAIIIALRGDARSPFLNIFGHLSITLDYSMFRLG